jgi:hypothetical protein
MARAFFTIWTLIGAFILFEWFAHGASWDGVFSAIQQHQARARVQGVM